MKRGRLAGHVWYLGLAWALLVGGDRAACAAEGLKRWAILASPEVRQGGLGDLLTAEATRLPGLELVERAELDRILGELTLASLGAADGPERRLQAGRLLRADALVLNRVHPRRAEAPTTEALTALLATRGIDAPADALITAQADEQARARTEAPEIVKAEKLFPPSQLWLVPVMAGDVRGLSDLSRVSAALMPATTA